MNTIDIHEQKIIRGETLTEKEAYELLSFVEQVDEAELNRFYDAAGRITRAYCGDRFDTCSIINCKSGNCPEDCKWCAQSVHYITSAEKYTLLPAEESVAMAVRNRHFGIGRFSLVASGRSATNAEIKRIADTYRRIGEATDIKLCASLGLLEEEQLRELYDAGVSTYHCNMETAPSKFAELCSTHSQADKEKTISAARRVGMRICSGGIIGMGETAAQRVEFALYLRSLRILSIPVNVLQPIAGTPLGKAIPLTDRDVLMTIALFRFINPSAYLRFSGGRIRLSDELQCRAVRAGINAAITGDMLTTAGESIVRDMRMISAAGLVNTNEYDWRDNISPCLIAEKPAES